MPVGVETRKKDDECTCVCADYGARYGCVADGGAGEGAAVRAR